MGRKTPDIMRERRAARRTAKRDENEITDQELAEMFARGDRALLAQEPTQSGSCGDPECHVLHDDPQNPIHPPWYKDSRCP